MLEFKGFTEEQLYPIVGELIVGDKLKALLSFQGVSGKTGTEAIVDLMSLHSAVMKAMGEDESFCSRFAPSRCCRNCIGVCGRFEFLKGLPIWSKSDKKFLGHDCTDFVSYELFTKTTKRKVVIGENRKSEATSYERFTYFVGPQISTITKERIHGRNGSTLKQASCGVIVEGKKILGKIAKKIRSGKFLLTLDRNEQALDLRVKGEDPLPGESYTKYFARVQKDIREKRKAFTDRIYSLSYEGVVEEILKALGETEKVVLEKRYKGDVNKFVREFFPNMDLWRVLESISQ